MIVRDPSRRRDQQVSASNPRDTTQETRMSNNHPGGSRAAYYEQIAQQRMAPLWESLHNLVPKAPQPKAQPAIWKYAQVRDLVMQAGSVISAEYPLRRSLGRELRRLPRR